MVCRCLRKSGIYFVFKVVLIQLSETRIRPSPDVPLRLLLPLSPQTMVTVLPTRRRPRAKHQAPFPPDVTTMIPKLRKPKVTSHAPLIPKPLATQGTFRCDFNSDESSCYLPLGVAATSAKACGNISSIWNLRSQILSSIIDLSIED